MNVRVVFACFPPVSHLLDWRWVLDLPEVVKQEIER